MTLKSKIPSNEIQSYYFVSKDKSFHGRRILKLPERWQKIVDKIVD